MPATPNEHIDKNTPAPTPTDQQENKSNNASPFMSAAPASVEAPLSVEQTAKQRLETAAATPGDGDCNVGNMCGNNGNVKSSSLNTSSDTCNANGGVATPVPAINSINNELKHILSLLKRPTLMSRDYEDIELEDDASMRHSLYDYTSLEAWMNHPVKRHRPNEENKLKKSKQIGDLYAAFENKRTPDMAQTETDAASQFSDANQSRSMNNEQNAYANDNYSESIEGHEIKREPGESDADGKSINMDNLFTSKGLVASFKDLDQIFDSTEDSPLGVSILACSIHDQPTDKPVSHFRSKCTLRQDRINRRQEWKIQNGA